MSNPFVVRGLHLALLLSWLILDKGHTKLLFLGLLLQVLFGWSGRGWLPANCWLSLRLPLLSLLAVAVVAGEVAVLAKPFRVVDFVRVSTSPGLF